MKRNVDVRVKRTASTGTCRESTCCCHGRTYDQCIRECLVSTTLRLPALPAIRHLANISVSTSFFSRARPSLFHYPVFQKNSGQLQASFRGGRGGGQKGNHPPPYPSNTRKTKNNNFITSQKYVQKTHTIKLFFNKHICELNSLKRVIQIWWLSPIKEIDLSKKIGYSR